MYIYMDSLTWTQAYYFTKDEILEAKNNVSFLTNKIDELTNKLNKCNDDDMMRYKQQSHINRLIMSNKCIKYYYQIN